jgi:hypothetical protein
MVQGDGGGERLRVTLTSSGWRHHARAATQALTTV